MEVGKINGKVCPVCGKENVHIGIGAGHIVGNGKNLLDFDEYTCTCYSCGAPVYNEKMDRENRVLEAEAFRKLHPELLTLKQIRGLPQRYNITRKDFCSVMGVPKYVMEELDEVPFRLFEGDLPDAKLESRLRAIHEDPKQWIEFLGLAEKRLSKEAFKKSKAKAMEMIK